MSVDGVILAASALGLTSERTGAREVARQARVAASTVSEISAQLRAGGPGLA